MTNQTQTSPTTIHRCPRCPNRLRLLRDGYGAYWSCLCGFTQDVTDGAALDYLGPTSEGRRQRVLTPASEEDA